jgi:cell wall-associated NlpC family hydrolase
MGLLGLSPHKIEPCELRPGDHIYTDRNLKTYYHHGIYIGNDRVIHLTKVSSHHPAKQKDEV